MSPRLLLIIALIAGFGAPAEVSAQRARVVLPDDAIRVGQPMELSIVAEYPGEFDLDIPRPAGGEPAMLGDFELNRLIDRSVVSVDYMQIRDSIVFEAMTFALDTASIAGERLLLIGSRDTSEVLLAQVQVPVAATWQEGDPPRDLAPIVDIPDRRWIWGVVALALVVAAVVFWLRRRARRRGEEPAADDPRPAPIDEARLRLKQLGTEIPSTPELRHGFAIELTDIIRTYITRRFSVSAHEMTSREILHHPSISSMLDNSTVDASRLLDLVDRIKFARVDASGPMLRTSLDESATWLSEMEAQAIRSESEHVEVPA